jgi:hypothetical protein
MNAMLIGELIELPFAEGAVNAFLNLAKALHLAALISQSYV